ncbi:MAG TPA: DUF2306 domain-containing protein, partial [Burkholderiales bacterium]|nr:DUF2306 domain-containing protein [Burkholderiales bacterium]
VAAWCFLIVADMSYNVFWPIRYALLLYFIGAAVALSCGISRFWASLRRRDVAVRGWVGRFYLTGVGVGAAGALSMSLHSVVGWTFGVATFFLGVVWVATTAMTYRLLRREYLHAHREWMTRSYIVTFSFVVFWLLVVSPAFAGAVLPQRLATFLWLSWSLPLLINEMILQWRRSAANGRVYFV